jgi:DNA (cytosine-5)-methyltransferase 1
LSKGGESVSLQQDLFSGIIVDNFAGGGGASTGIKQAIGRDVDIAINHDPAAIAMHKANHPYTQHLCESVWDVDPRKVVQGRPVSLCWLSPDCKHFSKAKGGKPVEKNIRGLAWVAVRWAATVRPQVIILENVEEFKTWGPLTKDGYPDPDQKGRTFNSFVNALKRQGYQVDFRELRACDYGAPTSRKRLFMIARCDGLPIVWPEPSHSDPKSSSTLPPWRTAAEIIDWSLPCPSIFDRKRPLAENTLKRIAKGIQKFVVENPEPFIVQVNHGGSFRGQTINEPLPTITAKHGYGIVTPFLTQYHSYDDTARGQSLDRPLLTLDTSNRYALVKAFLIAYYGTSVGSKVTEPLPTVVSKDRFGLVVVGGLNYQISDIGMRMLEPRELFNAQGFPPDYIIDRDYTGKAYPKSAQVARCGNSVPPAFAEALVRANLPELCRAAA